MTALLDIENLQAWYGPSQALFGVDLNLQEGQVAIFSSSNPGQTQKGNRACFSGNYGQ